MVVLKNFIFSLLLLLIISCGGGGGSNTVSNNPDSGESITLYINYDNQTIEKVELLGRM